MKQRLKRDYYTDPKYYYTALRLMVKLYLAPKPKEIGNFKLYKTVRQYVIESSYNLYNKDKFICKVPVRFTIPIKSKSKENLKISVPKPFYYYGVPIRKKLKEYYSQVIK